MSSRRDGEAARLERLWSGEFGDAYTERNVTAGERREDFWRRILSAADARSILEVGSNLGANLRWARALRPEARIAGVDVNHAALAEMRAALDGVQAVQAAARSLPFPDASWDLVFTVGVLIHQPPESLPVVIDEIRRCARRHILAAEYYSAEPVEIPYRGHRGALFKRDYGALYAARWPELRLRDHGFLPRAQGWDDVTFWLFETPA